jgi:hypothetical protein
VRDSGSCNTNLFLCQPTLEMSPFLRH